MRSRAPFSFALCQSVYAWQNMLGEAPKLAMESQRGVCREGVSANMRNYTAAHCHPRNQAKKTDKKSQIMAMLPFNLIRGMCHMQAYLIRLRKPGQSCEPQPPQPTAPARRARPRLRLFCARSSRRSAFSLKACRKSKAKLAMLGRPFQKCHAAPL